MQEALEYILAKTTADRMWDRIQRIAQMRSDAIGKTRRKIGQTEAEDRSVERKEFVDVRACLYDDMVGLAEDEQNAMRLDGLSELDLFPLAIRKVGLPERRGVGRLGGRTGVCFFHA
jgi:hypothetical protein